MLSRMIGIARVKIAFDGLSFRRSGVLKPKALLFSRFYDICGYMIVG